MGMDVLITMVERMAYTASLTDGLSVLFQSGSNWIIYVGTERVSIPPT